MVDVLRILIVEDDPAVALGLRDFVRGLGYEPVVARDGAQAMLLYDQVGPALVLLDRMLPKRSGDDVCRDIRDRSRATSIIMLTAKGQPHDRVDGLDLGADDYVTKPFDLSELAARIRAVLRRSEPATHADASVHVLAGTRIDLGQYVVERDGHRYELSQRESDILAFLLARRPRVVSRNEILDAVWGSDAYPSTRTVDNYIVSLRKKLEPVPSSPRMLLSVRSAGYKLVDPGIVDR